MSKKVADTIVETLQGWCDRLPPDAALHGHEAADREGPDVRCRRLLFRCWHRGTQESDLILGSFAEDSLGALDSDQLARFEALLDCTDPDLFDWIFGVSDPPPEHDHDVMRLLRSFCIERHRTPRQIGQHRI